jgi:hypothetical protein
MFYIWYFWQTWAANGYYRKSPYDLWLEIGILRLVIRYPRRTWHYEQLALLTSR